MARAVAKLSTCPRKAVGCVLLDSSYTVIASGYNGAARGLGHCGCALVDIGGRPSCVRAVHAEVNAIYSAAREGRRVEGTIAVSTCRPCERCAIALYQAGVVACWYEEEYEGRSQLVDELRGKGWTCERLAARKEYEASVKAAAIEWTQRAHARNTAAIPLESQQTSVVEYALRHRRPTELDYEVALAAAKALCFTREGDDGPVSTWREFTAYVDEVLKERTPKREK